MVKQCLLEDAAGGRLFGFHQVHQLEVGGVKLLKLRPTTALVPPLPLLFLGGGASGVGGDAVLSSHRPQRVVVRADVVWTPAERRRVSR